MDEMRDIEAALERGQSAAGMPGAALSAEEEARLEEELAQLMAGASIVSEEKKDAVPVPAAVKADSPAAVMEEVDLGENEHGAATVAIKNELLPTSHKKSAAVIL